MTIEGGARGFAGPIVVSGVGDAEGCRALAAALACAASERDRAALLVEVGSERPPRPALLASTAARRLEERVAAHLPDAAVAARGMICHLALQPGGEELNGARAALPCARDSLGVALLPQSLLRAALGSDGFDPAGALLRADLARDRALTALAARDLLARGVAVAVAKHPLSWVAARRALFGALPAGAPGGLSPRLLGRLALPRNQSDA